MTEDDEIRALRSRLYEQQDRLDQREAELLDHVTMQAIALTLLKFHRSKGRIKPAALNDIRFARKQWSEGDFKPRQELDRILSETIMDKEIRKDTPRG